MTPRDLFNRDGDRFSGDDDIVQKVKLHDLSMALHYDTGKAVLVSETGEEEKAKWLPKSQVEIEQTGKTVTAVKKDGQSIALPLVTVTVPEWLAKDKGLM